MMTIYDGYANETIGFSPEEAQETMNDPVSTDTLETSNEPVGGSFGSWFKRNFSKGMHVVRRIMRPLSSALSLGSLVAPELMPLAIGANALNNVSGSGMSHLHQKMRRHGGSMLNQ